jgi:uncharacterized membrane protein YhaH (DUF805 family)
MGLLKFIGAVFLLIFGLIFLIFTIPTLLLGTFLTGNLTDTIIITLIEAVVGIVMFASGLYIGVRELRHTEIHIEAEQVVTNKTEPTSLKNEESKIEDKPATEFDYTVLLIGLAISAIIFLVLFSNL